MRPLLAALLLSVTVCLTAQSSARADVAATLNVTLSRSAATRGRMVFLLTISFVDAW